MSLQLYLTELEGGNDVVAFLWDAEKNGEPEHGTLVDGPEDFEVQAFEVMGASTRTRSITLVDDASAARAVVVMQGLENEAQSVILKIDDDLFCVGSVMFSGEYDDGIPMINDFTTGETAPDISPEVIGTCSYFRLEEDDTISCQAIGAAEVDYEMG